MATALETAKLEVSAFFSAIARVKTFRPTKYNRNGATYTVYEDLGDGNAGQKKLAVHQAVSLITSKGFSLPTDTRFYVTNTYEAQNRAFHFDPLGRPVCWVTLGMAATKGGSGSGISAQPTNNFAPETKVTIHEIGHTLHAHNVGVEQFFKPSTKDRWKGCAVCAGEVSQYAAGTKKEFVAEVFLGTMIGRNYSNKCKQEYALLGGPRILASSSSSGFMAMS
ncbi:hypothetical protein [Acidocella facilis]|uniref:hypothetical protein n=1 Tax=Acidocella facilis TaxID=525 RepID=UPI0012DF5A75|nr:hypothetical protein [Acidocella facilis]